MAEYQNLFGTLQEKDFWISKGGTGAPTGKVVIDGEKIVVFQTRVETAKAVPLGKVEYNVRPTPDGKGKQLTFIRSLSENSASSAEAKSPTTTESAPSTSRTTSPQRNEVDRQARIEFQMALKLASQKLAADASLDDVFGKTWELYNRYLEEAKKLQGAGNPTK